MKPGEDELLKNILYFKQNMSKYLFQIKRQAETQRCRLRRIDADRDADTENVVAETHRGRHNCASAFLHFHFCFNKNLHIEI